MCSRLAWISSIHASTATTQPGGRRCPARRLARRANDVLPGLTNPKVSGTEFALFVQDRWRVNDRLSFELGMRVDFDDIVEGVNLLAARACPSACFPKPRDSARRVRQILRAHAADGRRVHACDVQTVSRFAADGAPLGAPVTFVHVLDGKLRTPESIVQNRRLGPAIRPPLLQGRLPPPRRITCIRSSGPQPRRF